MAPSALHVSGSRVFTPEEVRLIRAVITKPSLVALFNLLIFTGMRLSEVSQLVENPSLFKADRRHLVIVSTKTQAKEKRRDVWLNDKGVLAVTEYLKNPYIPSSPSVWQNNLIRWCRAAGLSEVDSPDAPSNPYMVTARSTRKSWESWLFKSYPQMQTEIILSQGHTELTALKHYLALRFKTEEVRQIKEETLGWEILE